MSAVRGRAIGAALVASLIGYTPIVFDLTFDGSVAHAALTPAQRCQQGKSDAAVKYALCQRQAEARFARQGNAAARAARLAKCVAKFGHRWATLEKKAGGTCPSTGDQARIQAAIDTYMANVATALAGGELPDYAGEIATCQADLATCQDGYETCSLDPPAHRLQTGQVTCWNSSGAFIPCAGTGQDGELQKGLIPTWGLSDGMIWVGTTGLVWEVLSDDGSIHDKDATYTWDGAFAKIATLNSGGGFAGHTDWRLPNVNELQSLVSYQGQSPATWLTDNCTPGCTVLTCWCATSGGYWSSTTFGVSREFAWTVEFFGGQVVQGPKSALRQVRAVRDWGG